MVLFRWQLTCFLTPPFLLSLDNLSAVLKFLKTIFLWAHLHELFMAGCCDPDQHAVVTGTHVNAAYRSNKQWYNKRWSLSLCHNSPCRCTYCSHYSSRSVKHMFITFPSQTLFLLALISSAIECIVNHVIFSSLN